MATDLFTPADLSMLASRGVTPEQAEAQMRRFTEGFPPLTVKGAARTGRNILVLTPDEQELAMERWDQYLADGGEVCKFVPASGAASRMFKALYEFVDGPDDTPAEGSPVAQLVAKVSKWPFLADLDAALARLYGPEAGGAREMLKAGRTRDVIRAIISPEGLGYGELPKALLKFHTYPDGQEPRTALDEQLDEGAQTVARSNGRVALHFTVSAAHRERFEHELAKAIAKAEKRTGLKFDVSVSEQLPSTDTIAANPDGTPFRQADGSLLLRPGGHGALIRNLADLNQAVVFIKNIDNVVPACHRSPTVRYKRVLGGLLLTVHDQIAGYLRRLNTGDYTDARLAEMASFLRLTLATVHPDFESWSRAEKVAYLKRKFNRPLRVCGMVRNEGEPGGGPYIAVDPDGSSAPQVLESTQIEAAGPEAVEMMSHATHFNPVDLVCFLKDLEGRPYDLSAHVDPATGFISHKSSHGRELLAMELPGLWNGAMSDWSTVFVEVPISTFNPVKTVNDLMRPMHLPM